MAIEITGNTFPVKDKIRQLGCTWNPTKKCWLAPNEQVAAKARALVSGAPAPAPYRGNSYSYNRRPGTTARKASAKRIAPPPPKLGPVEDVVAEAAKLGRVSTGGTPVCFRRESDREDNPIGDLFWGVDRATGVRSRYLTVRSDLPHYLGGNYLEDMEDFTTEPGWYVAVIAIPVQPTEEEIANDPKKIKEAKEAREREKYRLESLVRQSPQVQDPRLQQFPHVEGKKAEKLWGSSRMAGSENFYVSDGKLIYATSHYDDGAAVWIYDPTVEELEAALTLSRELQKS